MLPPQYLRTLRNDASVFALIFELRIPTRMRGSRLTFRCPQCGSFHTAVNHRTNLARCFGCKHNFNPIDLVMAERKMSFLEAVKYLEGVFSFSLGSH
jgi:DNA primase